jgi:hypothetical protein
MSSGTIALLFLSSDADYPLLQFAATRKIHIIEVLNCWSGITVAWRVFSSREVLYDYESSDWRGSSPWSFRDRSQVFNPVTQRWTKRDTETGRFMDQKTDGKPFKGVRKEK